MPTRNESDATSDPWPVKEPSPTRDGSGSSYQAVRQMTERLAQPLGPEDCQVQSMPDASPVKWHLAHTSWFFETFVLVPHASGYEAFHPSFNYLFNSYYNAVGDRLARPDRGLITRPTLEEVYAYRRAVDRAMQRLSRSERAGTPCPGRRRDRAGAQPRATASGADPDRHQARPGAKSIAARLSRRRGKGGKRPGAADGVAAVRRRTQMAGPRPGEGFAFDNEGPRHRVYLEPFLLGSRLVTSGEFLAFIQDGGYRRPELWLSDGWNLVKSRRWEAPLYWERIDGGWWVFTLGGFRRLAEAEPVCHVSYYEADAFARWAGARLPTEAEWESAAGPLEPDGNLLETGRFHPRAAEDGTGIAQCFGDTWEWTQSPYTPYPGSRPMAGALGEYNAKFMCNQLVLRGGSCATPATHIRATYRNFFPPESRWQFTGIRLAKDE